MRFDVLEPHQTSGWQMLTENDSLLYLELKLLKAVYTKSKFGKYSDFRKQIWQSSELSLLQYGGL